LTGGASAFPAGLGTTTGTTTKRDPMGQFANVLGALGSFGQGYGAVFNPTGAK